MKLFLENMFLQKNLFGVMASVSFISNWYLYLLIALTLPLATNNLYVLLCAVMSQILFMLLSPFNEFANFFKKLYYFETVFFLCILKYCFIVANVDNLDTIFQLLAVVYIFYLASLLASLYGKWFKKHFDERGLKNGSNN